MSMFAFNLVFGAVIAQDEGDETTSEETEETSEEVTTEQEDSTVVEEVMATIDNLDTVWILVAGFLVFFMQAGFALVEAGFVRARNVTNIMMKNFFDLSIGAIAFWAIGFGIMFGTGNSIFGKEWFFLKDLPDVYPGLTIPGFAFFFFQFAFAATAATIASGAMAERTEFKGYLIYSGLVTAFIYPLVGHWIWGGGWLASMDTPFLDFAGSTVVHSTGAWVGLMGALFLGARRNRFGKEGSPIPGHSMTLAALGTFILWLGWFGFNPGSQLNADGASIALITVTTNIAAAAGALSAMFIGWYVVGKPQLPWGFNGALDGGDQIGERLADTRAGFHDKMRVAVERGFNSARHVQLLRAVFVPRKLLGNQPAGTEDGINKAHAGSVPCDATKKRRRPRSSLQAIWSVRQPSRKPAFERRHIVRQSGEQVRATVVGGVNPSRGVRQDNVALLVVGHGQNLAIKHTVTPHDLLGYKAGIGEQLINVFLAIRVHAPVRHRAGEVRRLAPLHGEHGARCAGTQNRSCHFIVPTQQLGLIALAGRITLPFRKAVNPKPAIAQLATQKPINRRCSPGNLVPFFPHRAIPKRIVAQASRLHRPRASGARLSCRGRYVHGRGRRGACATSVLPCPCV
jgi:hypothetical protein